MTWLAVGILLLVLSLTFIYAFVLGARDDGGRRASSGERLRDWGRVLVFLSPFGLFTFVYFVLWKRRDDRGQLLPLRRRVSAWGRPIL